jgi:hypothetical protein
MRRCERTAARFVFYTHGNNHSARVMSGRLPYGLGRHGRRIRQIESSACPAGEAADPDKISSFMNIRVADIQTCYKLWKSRGAEFITEPILKYGEIRCYIRDPDGYIIEVGQSTDLT